MKFTRWLLGAVAMVCLATPLFSQIDVFEVQNNGSSAKVWGGGKVPLNFVNGGCSTNALTGAMDCTFGGDVADVSVTTATNPSSETQLKQLSLPAAALNVANRHVKYLAAGRYTTNTGQTPTLRFRLYLCTVSGCGSGTVLTLADFTTAATTGATTNSWKIEGDIGTAATGATGTLEAKFWQQVQLGAAANLTPETRLDQTNAVSSTIDLTAALFLRLTVLASTSDASNTVSARMAYASLGINGGGWSGSVSGGDFSSNTSSSVDGEFVLFSSTGGKTGKRASGTGFARGASGVSSFAEISGDCTTSGSATITCTKTGGSSFAASATTDTTVASNIGSGTLPAGRMPALTGAVTSSAGAVATSMGKLDVTDANSFCSDAGANDTYACNLSPAVTAYVTGTHYRFKANTANTGAASVNFNSVGALTIKKVSGGVTTDLADNDIRAGQWVECVYDGTNCQMASQLGNAASGSGTPGGSDTQCQFNDGGSFGGDAGCTYNKTTDKLTVGSLATSGSGPDNWTAQADPGSPADGDDWYSSTTAGRRKFYDGTTTQTYAFKSDTLAAFAATTSAQLLGVISDEVGSGSKVAKFDSVSGNSGIAAQSTGSLTSGNVPKFDASGNIVDGSVVAANIVTQTSNASSGQVCTYTGANKVCVPATALPSGVTATTQTAKDNTTKVATTAYVDNPVGTTTGTSVTLTAPSQIFVCTSTCTITMPVPAAGYQFCVYNGDNVTTVITFAAIGSSARYENAARTAYGTAGTGTLVSGGAAKDYACLLGLDSTHYLFVSGNGTWVAN